MKNVTKITAFVAAGFALLVLPEGAHAAGPYSCTDSTYGGSYSDCSTNNTANQSSTVATATTVLRAASTQTSSLVSNRVSAALGGSGEPSMKVASNNFAASSGMAGGDGAGKAGVWISGSWSNSEDENDDTEFDGDTYTTLVGADYEVSPGVILGLSVGYENTDIDTEYNGFGGQDGNLDADGYTVAPYIGAKFSENVSGDLTVGYSSIDYDTLRYDPNTGNSITGSTDADRYFVNAGVNGVHNFQNNWNLKGRGAVFYASEDKDAFTETESNGSTISVNDETTELGQLLFDTRLGYTYQHVEPYVLVGVEYDFSKDDVPVAAGQTQSQDDDFGMKFGLGLNLIDFGSNVSGGIEAYTVEFRDDYNEYVATGGLRVEF